MVTYGSDARMEGETMTKYQLAKLVALAGTFVSRKRIQKTIHLLKVAGCPIDADFRLLCYGPYSSEVAQLLDEMTANELLEEETEVVGLGKEEYSYRLPEHANAKMEQFESTDRGREAAKVIAPFVPLFADVCKESAKTLEYASTIAYFRQAGRHLDEAVAETAKYKNAAIGASSLNRARELAERIVHQAHDAPKHRV